MVQKLGDHHLGKTTNLSWCRPLFLPINSITMYHYWYHLWRTWSFYWFVQGCSGEVRQGWAAKWTENTLGSAFPGAGVGVEHVKRCFRWFLASRIQIDVESLDEIYKFSQPHSFRLLLNNMSISIKTIAPCSLHYIPSYFCMPGKTIWEKKTLKTYGKPLSPRT